MKTRATTGMEATKQYFPAVLSIMLYKVVVISSLWMKSHREKSVIPCAVSCALVGGSNVSPSKE